MTLRKRTTLYRYFNADGELLYVGISDDHDKRACQHEKTADWFDQVANITGEFFYIREVALERERYAIATEKPKYNVVHNHDSQVAILFATLGRKNMAQRLGVGLTAIGNVASRDVIPPSWFIVIRNMCEEVGVDLPESLFSFIEDQGAS